MAIDGADHGAGHAVDLVIPDVADFRDGHPHEAHATLDGDILTSPHPSPPWLATLLTYRVHSGLRLSRNIILLDSACTTHIVTESWLLDDFVTNFPGKYSVGKFTARHACYRKGNLGHQKHATRQYYTCDQF